MSESPGPGPERPELHLPEPKPTAADHLVGFAKVLLILIAGGVVLAVLAFGTCLLAAAVG